jgi:hypothetical protein
VGEENNANGALVSKSEGTDRLEGIGIVRRIMCSGLQRNKIECVYLNCLIRAGQEQVMGYCYSRSELKG